MENQASKIKILMVDSLTGNDYCFILCNHLSQLSVDVHLIVNKDRLINIPFNFRIFKLSPSKLSGKNKIKKLFEYIIYLLKIYTLVNRYKIDIVHFQFFRRARIETLFCLLLKIRKKILINTVHDVLPLNESKVDRFFKHINYLTFNHLLVHSNFNKNQLIKHFNIPTEKIWVVPHGNFDDYLHTKQISPNAARETLGIQKGDHVILFFGNIKEYKGLDMLLDAMKISHKLDNKITLVIAGICDSKQLYDHYNDLVLDLNKHMKIIFHNKYIPFNDVQIYLRACDLVALPYKTISHSGILHLAFSFGKPVITTRVGDFTEFVKYNETGYVLKENNIQCLSDTIKQAFADINHLKKMGENAKKLSDNEFSWSTIAERTKKVYDTALRY